VPTAISDFYCHQAIPGLVDINVVMETDRVMAFHHTRPAHPVHIVVVPKEHIPSLVDLGDNNEDLLLEVMNAVREVAEMVRAEHGAVSMITCARCPAMRYADSARALLEQAAESGPAS
jgi:histidine triad (HIT) family protein